MLTDIVSLSIVTFSTHSYSALILLLTDIGFILFYKYERDYITNKHGLCIAHTKQNIQSTVY